MPKGRPTASGAGSAWPTGIPQPYRLRYMELGNEERVDEKYAAKFEALAEGHLGQGPGDHPGRGRFRLRRARFSDPMNFSGAASGITSLAGQQQILRLAKQHNREVWFDVHVGTDGPAAATATLDGDVLLHRRPGQDRRRGAKHKVVVFEFNAGNHAQKRALANALAINAVERDGRMPIVTSANCLQPDGQNDNGWDQGLLFLNPSQVWLQPPGYVTQMLSRNYLPQLVKCQVTGAEGKLDANAKRSDDGKTLVLQVVNSSEKAVTAQIQLAGFVPAKPAARSDGVVGAAGSRKHGRQARAHRSAAKGVETRDQGGRHKLHLPAAFLHRAAVPVRLRQESAETTGMFSAISSLSPPSVRVAAARHLPRP